MRYANVLFITAFILLLVQTVVAQEFVLVAAGKQYKSKSRFQRIVKGKNYRAEWATPVKMPVFNIKKEQGGLKIIKMGGGMQTKSLRLEDSNGYKWVLRTVDKDVSNLFPKWMRSSPVKAMTQDMISAAHPYAALVVSALSDAVGVPTPHPKLVFVRDDPAFGEYRNVVANKVCFFEERSPTHNRKSDDLEELVIRMRKDTGRVYALMQKELLKVRLLDMLVADWDRHKNQYRFGIKDSAGKRWVYPVPVDHDQAFFYSEGLFAGVAKLFAPFLKGFRESPGNLKQLNYKARKFDRTWLSDLSARDWDESIRELQARLSDSVIDASVRRLPPEVYALSGQRIATILKSRRNALHAPAMRYYAFISHK
ncbi:hypothetical protein [Polluticoccus soli]|uniref:hypothetical protein n=1 Tax=Polluticoccus soli TaxID=3034150 RepID=UPI0023E23825|nr:hypothetical protein [Flavipsychrobacter sp. JY13-12]